MKSLARRSFHAAALLTLLGSLLGSGTALALDAPAERPILTITGKIGVTNTANAIRLDMKMIEALPQHSFTTHTPWFDRPVKFTGPLLADVLKLAQAQGTTIHATAINDYRIKIPMADAGEHGVIMARLLDDQPMAIREKGPLFIVYPFDASAKLRSSVYYERSIWQLKALDIQ
ncbi:MAG: hypothetical protein R3E99_05465 [Burkholderiaceae bacterium]